MNQRIHTARALLAAFWDFSIPISPAEYAEKLGLQVVESDGMGAKSGYLDAEKRIICVNANACTERKRFAIAHELGHFCLGHGSSRRDAAKPNWYAVNPEDERQANQFAVELLVPAIALKAMIEKRGVKDAAALREAFGVSSQALYDRLKELGCFI